MLDAESSSHTTSTMHLEVALPAERQGCEVVVVALHQPPQRPGIETTREQQAISAAGRGVTAHRIHQGLVKMLQLPIESEVMKPV